MSWVSNGRPRWDWSGGNSASEPLSGPGPCCFLGGLGSSIMGRDPLLGLVPVLYPAQPQKAKTAAGGRTEHRRKGNGGHGPPPAPLHACRLRLLQPLSAPPLPPGFEISAKFRRISAKFFVSVWYREKIFRYFQKISF